MVDLKKTEKVFPLGSRRPHHKRVVVALFFVTVHYGNTRNVTRNTGAFAGELFLSKKGKKGKENILLYTSSSLRLRGA
jgi:hypothetical protein